MIDIVAVALTTAILLTLLGLGLDQLPVRKKMRSVVELVRPQYDAENSSLRFYCWPCKTTHEFSLPDVEKIVYALGAAEVLALELGGDAGLTTECAELAAAGPSCLETVLEVARDGDAYREHVEQGIECRVKA